MLLIDLMKKVENVEPGAEIRSQGIGHWSSAKGWVKQVTLHGNTADNHLIKEFRALLLINDVKCRVTDKIHVARDFR